MENQNYIPVEELCITYEVPDTFLNELYAYDLINIFIVNEVQCVETSEIKKVEKIIRLHFDLNINMEGIDSVLHLLNRVNTLQDQITRLNNRISFHEHEHRKTLE